MVPPPTPPDMAPVRDVLLRLPRFLLPAGAILASTYFLPSINPFTLPHVDLSGSLGQTAFWVAESGSARGMPWMVLLLTVILVWRAGVSWKRRGSEASVLMLTLAALLGGGAYLNEHVVKSHFMVPRPYILELAKTPPEAPLLGMSPEEFYSMPGKASRSEHLTKVLKPDFGLHPLVREHWIKETASSFPSGHSFSSMMFATFFLAMGLSCFRGRQLWVFYVLILWAVAVCLSRPILRVHSPTDICVGGLTGIVVGVLAFVLARGVFAFFDRRSAMQSEKRGEWTPGNAETHDLVG